MKFVINFFLGNKVPKIFCSRLVSCVNVISEYLIEQRLPIRGAKYLRKKFRRSCIYTPLNVDFVSVLDGRQAGSQEGPEKNTGGGDARHTTPDISTCPAQLVVVRIATPSAIFTGRAPHRRAAVAYHEFWVRTSCFFYWHGFSFRFSDAEHFISNAASHRRICHRQMTCHQKTTSKIFCRREVPWTKVSCRT